MTEPMQVLYQYAQENMIRALLALEPDYTDALRHADSREKQLRALLDEPGRKHLTALLDEQSQRDFYWGQAQFCAGFRLALELAGG